MKAFIFSIVLFACVAYGVSVDVNKGCPQLQGCLDDIVKAKNTANITLVCNLMDKGSTCLDAVKCKNFTTMAAELDVKITDIEFSAGCDGDCAKELNKCLGPIAKALAPNTTFSFGLCKTVSTAIQCLKTISAPKCSEKTKDAVSFVTTSMRQNNFIDICDADGKPSKCYEDFNNCMPNINNAKGAKIDCTKIAKFLQCQSQISCKGIIKKFAAQVRQTLETSETQAKCPTVGSCNERMGKCADNVIKTVKKDTLSKTATKAAGCKLIKGAMTCFDNVKNDPICQLQEAAITDAEKSVKDLYKTCSSTSLMVSSLLVVAGSILAMFKNHF